MDTRKIQEIIPMDKLKEALISRTAEVTSQNQEIVEKIINFEFREARDAMREFSEVEISGFGKYVVAPAKLRRKLKRMIEISEIYEIKLGDETVSEKKRSSYTTRLERVRETIEYLKTK